MTDNRKKSMTEKEHRSWNMSRIKSKNTALELVVRRYLFRIGFRYRINWDVPGRPDIAFPGKKIAIFVNGCFWHNHGCKLSKLPSTNKEFWFNKLETNKRRDELNHIKLQQQGWETIDLWQCELENSFDSIMHEAINKINGK